MTQSEEQLASLNLLREALNYLERLPAHPMTYAMALKIRNHLSNPQTLALERRLHEAEAAEKFSHHGHSANFGFTNEGLPTLTASLLDGVLALKSPAAAQIPDAELGRVNTNSQNGIDGRHCRAWKSRPNSLLVSPTACRLNAVT